MLAVRLPRRPPLVSAFAAVTATATATAPRSACPGGQLQATPAFKSFHVNKQRTDYASCNRHEPTPLRTCSARLLRSYSSIPDIGRHFDTHTFVARLESQGFTREQAEVLVASLNDVISDSVQHMMKNVATKAEQEKTMYTYKVDFAALKGEIQMQEKNEYAMLKSENERLVGEVEKLKQKLREEITRTQAGVRLDISLFRGASRDEASAHELKIKETDARVQSDISDLRTEMERVKYSVLTSLIGTITGAGALILAYMRMFQH